MARSAMRALGPGSLSSLLRIGVEVAHAALWTALAALVLAALAILLFQPFVGKLVMIDLHGLNGQGGIDTAGRGPPLAALTAVVAVYVAGLVLIFNRLRRVCETLTLGDPFRPQNVERLRVIGLTLIGLELLGAAIRAVTRWALPEAHTHAGVSVNFTAWFAILVVFVLSEVFREGARLRGEAELTI